MSIQELEAEALKLSVAEREELIRRLLAHEGEPDMADPLLGLGSDPVECGAPDASVHRDRYLHGAVD